MIGVITSVALLQVILKFSKTSVIPDIITIYSCLLYFIGPYLAYTYFDRTFEPAVRFDFVMPIAKEQYYSYAVPALLMFFIGLQACRANDEKKQLETIIYKLKQVSDLHKGYTLIIVGIVAFYFINLVPSFLRYITTICFLLTFAGFMMLQFNTEHSKTSRIIQVLVVLWIVYYGIRTTMFTVVFYMGVTLTSIIFLKYNISWVRKIIGVIIFAILAISLQYVKTNYRTLLRKGVENDITITRFVELYYSTVTNIDQITNIANMFPLHLRFNNGFYLALVMKRMPNKVPYDQGSALGKTLLASVIPRLIWPGKPQAGGIYNMKYYAGINVRHTVNVGPIGEAYGSFGRTGGAIYMFFFGLVLSVAHRLFISMANKNTILFIFMPMIFYETLYCMENDSMQALNSIIKITLFLFIAFKLFPGFFRLGADPTRAVAI